MIHGYTDEKQIQILIALLKEHGIKKVIASPGTTNVTFVGSIQYDPWFEIYSSVDERSAAYMACGLAAESGEPVCLSCTGATASRNYIPGLTEAFYRKLPILALTASQHIGRVGHYVPQVIDRSNLLNDIANYSCTLPFIKSEEDEWDCQIKVNSAILALKRRGGGPAHINVQQAYSHNFDVMELPQINKIERYTIDDKLPDLPKGEIVVWVGNHKKMSPALVDSIDAFCNANNAVVFTDHTSGYNGKFKVNYALVASQQRSLSEVPDLLIHIGEVSGAYYGNGKNVWRVSEDGEIRDLFKKLCNVFEMSEKYFFDYYTKNTNGNEDTSYYEECSERLNNVRVLLPEIPFSNLWCASQTAHKIPEGSAVHLGILNSLRCWNLFDFPKSVEGFSNTGGFGIDGGMSSAIGACLANKKRLHFLVIGDLAFFYDLNSIGNRHVLNNLRILLVNNGKGTEFRNFNHPGAAFGEDADQFIAAGGHYGNKSSVLIKHYAEDLGFEYITASNKEEYLANLEKFTSDKITSKPILFEIFTTNEDESNALQTVYNLEVSVAGTTKNFAKKILGKKGTDTLKKMLGR